MDHLQARWMHTHATMVGGYLGHSRSSHSSWSQDARAYLRHIVVRCKELVAMK